MIAGQLWNEQPIVLLPQHPTHSWKCLGQRIPCFIKKDRLQWSLVARLHSSMQNLKILRKTFCSSSGPSSSAGWLGLVCRWDRSIPSHISCCIILYPLVSISVQVRVCGLTKIKLCWWWSSTPILLSVSWSPIQDPVLHVWSSPPLLKKQPNMLWCDGCQISNTRLLIALGEAHWTDRVNAN